MPKMTNPNAERPLSVQPDEVDYYAGLGWTVVGKPAQAEKKPATKPAKTAMTRKAASSKKK